jgi:glycosyltransferase involved in cell wall biosynthesis
MYNGIRAERFDRDEGTRRSVRDALGLNNRFVWLAIGRLEEAKDFPNLFQAVDSLVVDYPETLVLVVGRGILRDTLQRLIEDMGLSDHVRLIGERSDIPDVMNACDAYVMSSAWEGLPIVLLEAGAASLPVVATDVGGNNELVLDGKTGFLVPPSDSKRLADRMKHVMDLPDAKRERLGLRGRRHVESTFDMEQILDRWQELYEELQPQ